MKTSTILTTIALAAALILFATPASAQTLRCSASRTALEDLSCFPTCAPHVHDNAAGTARDDGRFISLAGAKQQTLTGPEVVVPLAFEIACPAAAPYLEIGIFDGDTEPGVAGRGSKWDFVGSDVSVDRLAATVVTFALYADTDDDKELDPEDAKIGEISGNDMPDDNWCNLVVTGEEHPEMIGVERFFVVAELDPRFAETTVTSNFKVRSNGNLSVPAEPFSFQAALMQDTFFDLFPQAPGEDLVFDDNDVAESAYDGSWVFYLDVQPERPGKALTHVTLWDGDFDRGSYEGCRAREEAGALVLDLTVPESDCDTPDLDTPAVFPRAIMERYPDHKTFDAYVTAGSCTITSNRSATGCPADDGQLFWMRRSPGVEYSVVLPAAGGAACDPAVEDCVVFTNENPSGNLEWEQFRLVTAGHPDASRCLAGCDGYDFLVDELPAGIYTVSVEGIDLNNLNAWFFQSASRSAPPGGGDGCTPGYWKQRQHFDSWPDEYLPGETLFSDVFGVGPEVTLLEALRAGGGGFAALGRHAVAALLNTANLSVDYLFPAGGLLDLVREAYENSEPEAAKDLLAGQNELGCPLD